MEEKSEFFIALVFQSGPVVEKDKSCENLSLRICDDSYIVKMFMNAALICESMEDSKEKLEVIRIVEETIRLMKASGKVNTDAFKSVIVYPSSPSKILTPDFETTPLRITDETRQFQAEVLSECREVRYSYFDRLCLLGSIFRLRCMRQNKNIENEVLVPQQLSQQNLPALPPLSSTSSDYLRVLIQDHTVVENSDKFYDNDINNDIVRNVDSSTCTLRSHEDKNIAKYESPVDDDQDQEQESVNMNQHQHLLSTHIALLNQLQSVSHPRSPLTHKNILILETATAIGLSICKAFLIWKYTAFPELVSSASVLSKDIHTLPSLQGDTFSSSSVRNTDALINGRKDNSVKTCNLTVANVDSIEKSISELNETNYDKILIQLMAANKQIPGLSQVDNIPSYESPDEQVRHDYNNFIPNDSQKVNGLVQMASDEFTYDEIYKKTEYKKSSKSVKNRLRSFLRSVVTCNESHVGSESKSISGNSHTFTGSNPLAQIGKKKVGRRISRPLSKRKNGSSLPLSIKLSR
jgi:hypothetical protein